MKNILKNYIDFYKSNLKIKHIVCTIISILIFVIFLISNIYEFSVLQNITYNDVAYFGSLKENILLAFIIIFAGITPYCFLSVIGFSSMYNIAMQVAILYITSQNTLLLILHCIVVVFIAVAYSLCISTGIYYCKLSSKKFKYSQKNGFNFGNVKYSIYKLRNDEEKIKKYEEKKAEKIKKIEELNVKVPYLNLIISFIISSIILVFTTLII